MPSAANAPLPPVTGDAMRLANVPRESVPALMVVLAVTVSVAASTAAPATTTGSVHIWVTPGKGAVDRILLSGVIADDGTATSIDKNGDGTRIPAVLEIKGSDFVVAQ